MPNPKRRHSKTRTAKRRTHDALKPVGPQRVPALPRAEAAAPRLRELRLLPRPPGARGRRGVDACRMFWVPGSGCRVLSVLRAETWARFEQSQNPEPNAEPGTLNPEPDGPAYMIWIAVDAMGGDDAPRHVVDGALAAVRHFDLGVALVGPADRARAPNCAGMPDVDASARPHRRRRRRRRDGRVAGGGAAPQAAARRSGWPPRLVARGEAAALFSAGHTGATVMAASRRVRHAARRRSAGAGGDDSDGRSGRRSCSTSARASSAGRSTCCSSPSWARVYARVAFGIDGAARRPAVDRRGRDEGQRADARGAPAAQGGAALVHRQRRSARRLQRRGRRHRLRRVHRQRRAEDQRRARCESACARLSVRADAAGAALRRRVDYSEYGGAPLLGVAGVAIVGHGRSSAKAVRNARRDGLPVRRRPVHRARRAATSRRRRSPTRDRVHLSRTGIAEGRHGQGAGRRLSRSAARRSTRPTPRSASR